MLPGKSWGSNFFVYIHSSEKSCSEQDKNLFDLDGECKFIKNKTLLLLKKYVVGRHLSLYIRPYLLFNQSRWQPGTYFFNDYNVSLLRLAISTRVGAYFAKM